MPSFKPVSYVGNRLFRTKNVEVRYETRTMPYLSKYNSSQKLTGFTLCMFCKHTLFVIS